MSREVWCSVYREGIGFKKVESYSYAISSLEEVLRTLEENSRTARILIPSDAEGTIARSWLHLKISYSTHAIFLTLIFCGFCFQSSLNLRTSPSANSFLLS